jgi:23S rRNA (uracil1939-C5)-methyltransferase
MRIRIEKLVHGGSGMTRTQEGVVFVNKVLPDELVEVEIVEKKKDYANARLIEVLEASPHRTVPTCPNFYSVGCCSWDHIDYPAQLALKEAIIWESLKRLGGIEFDRPIDRIAAEPTGYRLRAGFHVSNHMLGFVQERTHQVVPVSECAALMPELNEFIREANRALKKPKLQDTESVRAVASPETGEVAASFRSSRHRTSWGDHLPRIHIMKTEYRLRPDNFFQPNRYLLEKMGAEVVKATRHGEIILDLFCGSGFFSLLMARQAAKVVGVDRRSVSNAQWNARRNGIDNVEFVKASALSFLTKSPFDADTVVLDPPRKGTGKAIVKKVVTHSPNTIVYVSCNPATFAAEARAILDGGYNLRSLRFVDQFPNTHHIETTAVFDRNDLKQATFAV